MGNQAILSLETLHFSKAFFGTNGVSLKAGFSTPDYEEAMVKKTAIGQAKRPTYWPIIRSLEISVQLHSRNLQRHR